MVVVEWLETDDWKLVALCLCECICSYYRFALQQLRWIRTWENLLQFRQFFSKAEKLASTGLVWHFCFENGILCYYLLIVGTIFCLGPLSDNRPLYMPLYCTVFLVFMQWRSRSLRIQGVTMKYDWIPGKPWLYGMSCQSMCCNAMGR